MMRVATGHGQRCEKFEKKEYEKYHVTTTFINSTLRLYIPTEKRFLLLLNCNYEVYEHSILTRKCFYSL